MADEEYKNFAVVSVLIFWTASIYMVNKWKGTKSMSFSNHAASEKHAYILFAIAVTLETSLYALFTVKWFIPTFNMSSTFTVLFVLIAIGHFISGVVPETKGLAKKIHWWAAYIVAWLFIPTLAILATTQTISMSARIIAGLCLAMLFILWLIMMSRVVFKRDRRKHFLIYQAIYIATLPIALLATTYLR